MNSKKRKAHTNKRLKSILVFIFLSTSILGAVLILHGYTMKHPLSISNHDNEKSNQDDSRETIEALTILTHSVLSANSEIEIPENQNSSYPLVFSEFPPIQDRKAFIQFKTLTKTIVGYIDQDQAYHELYALPRSTTQRIKLLEDVSLMYIEENPVTNTQAIRYQTIDHSIFTLIELDPDETILDYLFSPIDSLYLLVIDSQGKQNIYKANGNAVQVVLSNVSQNITHFLNESNKGLLMQDNLGCLELQYETKTFSHYDCDAITYNKQELLFSIDDDSLSFATKNSENMFSAEERQIYSITTPPDFFMYDPNTKVIYLITSVEGDKPEAIITYINLETMDIQQDILPKNLSKSTGMFVANEYLYWIDYNGQENSLHYVPNPFSVVAEEIEEEQENIPWVKENDSSSFSEIKIPYDYVYEVTFIQPHFFLSL